MTKKDRRKAQLERHYRALESLARSMGATNPDGRKLSTKLLRIERDTLRATTDYCNGDCDEATVDGACEAAAKQVAKLFGTLPHGFFVNRDPRGCALKIDGDSALDFGIMRDWGGYGLLAPEITGD